MIERPSRRDGDQPGVAQFLEVKGHGGRGHADRVGQDAGGQPVGPGGHQRPHEAQAVLLPEGREGSEGLRSSIICQYLKSLKRRGMRVLGQAPTALHRRPAEPERGALRGADRGASLRRRRRSPTRRAS